MAKYCPKCGAELADDMAFCPKCGYKLETEEPVEEKKPEENVEKAPKKETKKAPKKEPEAVVEKAPEKEEKKSKALIFIILALVLLAIIGGLMFFLNRKCTVSFDTDGGTLIAEVKVAKGEPVARPADPSKEGFDFAGWSYNGKDYNFNDPVTQSLTLKALWNESKYVTFIVDGKEIAKEHIINGRVTFPQAPDLEGYSFIGWQDENKAEVTEENIFTDNVTLTANYKVYVPVTSIKYEKSAYEIEKGSTLKPKLVIAPTGWAEYLSYTTSDANVATVEPDGTITAHNAGKATITVNTESGKSAKTEVTVKISCKSVKFAQSEITINKGETVKLEYTIDPADTTDSISWGTSSKNVVKPDGLGSITGIGYGTATISLRCGDKKATIIVHVANPAYAISVTETLSLYAGESANLNAKLKPSDSTSTITYTTSDASVATVNSKGKVTGVKGGKCYIYLDTENDLHSEVLVYVDEYKLDVTLVQPSNATANYLFYQSNNRPVIKVNATLVGVHDGANFKTTLTSDMLQLVGGDDYLYWSAKNNELYVTNRGTNAAGLIRTYTKDIAFKCECYGRFVQSKKFSITVEPMLEISVSQSFLKYNSETHSVEISGGAGKYDCRIIANQKATGKPSSNVDLYQTSYAVNAPSSKPYYTYFDFWYSKSASQTGQLKVKTPGGQEVTVTIH